MVIKKKRILFILFSIVCILFIGYLNLLIALIIVSVAFIVLYANRLLLRSNLWHKKYQKMNDFLAQPLFRADFRRNFDIINLGSLTSCSNFSYKTIYGLNLSSGKQSFTIDNRILKFYHSYLKKSGYVALVMNPYEYVQKENFIYYSRFIKPVDITEKRLYGDYYKSQVSLLEMDQINESSLLKVYLKFPILFDGFSILLHYILKLFKVSNKIKIRQRFDLSVDDTSIILDMIKFCKERDYKPFIVISPVQNKYTNRKIVEFSKFVKDIFSKDVIILDYTDNKEWSRDLLFDNIPNCLKKEYCEEFTQLVYQDIENKYKIGTIL